MIVQKKRKIHEAMKRSSTLLSHGAVTGQRNHAQTSTIHCELKRSFGFRAIISACSL
jgi:hypothetical protein